MQLRIAASSLAILIARLRRRAAVGRAELGAARRRRQEEPAAQARRALAGRRRAQGAPHRGRERGRCSRRRAARVHADRATFSAINKDHNPESTTRYPALLTVAGADGAPRNIAVKLSARGHFRRMSRNCSVVPLRVEFPQTTAWPARRSTARRR